MLMIHSMTFFKHLDFFIFSHILFKKFWGGVRTPWTPSWLRACNYTYNWTLSNILIHTSISRSIFSPEKQVFVFSPIHKAYWIRTNAIDEKYFNMSNSGYSIRNVWISKEWNKHMRFFAGCTFSKKRVSFNFSVLCAIQKKFIERYIYIWE